MDTTTSIKPKTIAELLPGLSGILTRDTIQTLTAKKQPRKTMLQTRTAEKVTKPLTVAEMRADIAALKGPSQKSVSQGTSTKKKIWNSSVKVDCKTVKHTANGLKNNSVRKVLNFQPKAPVASRATMTANESPKFSRPDIRIKRSVYHQGRNSRISGIAAISETPVVNIPKKFRTLRNKESTSNQSNIKRNVPSKLGSLKKRMPSVVPETPLYNMSCDDSFLQKEKEIDDEEDRSYKSLSEAQISEEIVEVTPPASTPFKEYRNVPELFYPSTEFDNSNIIMYNNDTIMSFDNSETKADIQDATSIVSLTDLLSNVSIKLIRKPTKQENLKSMQAAAEKNLKVIDDTIDALKKLKESQETSIKYIIDLLQEKDVTTVTKDPKKCKLKEEYKTEIINIDAGPKGELSIKNLVLPQSVDVNKGIGQPIKIGESSKCVESRKYTPKSAKEPIKILDQPKDSVLERAKNLKIFNDLGAPEFLEITPKIDDLNTVDDNKFKHAVIEPESKPITIKTEAKSPTYKIPNRRTCLRKKLLCKSVPNIPSGFDTPVKSHMGTQALSMYMKMKKRMNFLNTPVLKRPLDLPDSPAITSHNLQKQLDELYDES